MPLFEVFIPSAEPDGFNITARIRAESWISALRSGLSKLGDAADVRNILCDINEFGIDVTEPTSGRVFRIRELGDSAPEGAAPGPIPTPALASPRAPAIRPRDTRPAVVHAQQEQAVLLDVPAQGATPRFHAAPDLAVTREKATGVVAPKIGRAKPAHVEEPRPLDDLMASLFEKTQDLYSKGGAEAAAGFLLDLAMRTVPSDSGSVFISDINRSDLYFAAARGPKAKEVMKFRVPMGQGIVGFCAQEGVALAISDAEKDPRFYAAISEALGYETRSILCSPALKNGRVFGAVELINRAHGTAYTSHEIDIVNYLAHAFADYLISMGL